MAKLSKCSFGDTSIEYLGHIVSQEGVATDPTKIQAVIDWPIPTTLKQLRGFLGLTGYYRKFVQNYGTIAKPLTKLIKKDSFLWSEEANLAFNALKTAMTHPPVLALPDYNAHFVIEIDASSQGIGAVLMQHGHPVAFISKALSPRNALLSTYERELLAVIHAVQKWSQYLLDRHFILKTDQESLKHLLDSKIVTPFQQKWLSKLLGFNFEILYKKGVDNTVADALSRVSSSNMLQLTLSTISSDIWSLLKQSWEEDDALQTIIANKQVNPTSYPRYHWHN